MSVLRLKSMAKLFFFLNSLHYAYPGGGRLRKRCRTRINEGWARQAMPDTRTQHELPEIKHIHERCELDYRSYVKTRIEFQRDLNLRC